MRNPLEAERNLCTQTWCIVQNNVKGLCIFILNGEYDVGLKTHYVMSDTEQGQIESWLLREPV